MSVDINKVIKWFTDRQNRLTYSMYGSRNGDDGTADCSGSMTQAIRNAGGKPYSYLYSTETIHPWLKDNGFKLISENGTWNAKRGDVVVFGQVGQSAGAGGHIGIITSNDPNAYFISTCYWTGGQAGTAIQNLPFDTMWEADGEPYFYVYRLQGSSSNNNSNISKNRFNYGDKVKLIPAASRSAYGSTFSKYVKNANGWVAQEKNIKKSRSNYVYVVGFYYAGAVRYWQVLAQDLKKIN